MQPSLNTIAPALSARDVEPAPPITDTPPKARAETANQILLPKALVDDVYREARKNFALIPDMTFALAAGASAVRDTWEHKDGKFLRKDKPFANYVPPKDEMNDVRAASGAHAPAASLTKSLLGDTFDQAPPGEAGAHASQPFRTEEDAEDAGNDMSPVQSLEFAGEAALIDAAEVRSDRAPRSDVYPEDPSRGMERLKRARRFGERVPPANGRKHWVDPKVGWEDNAVDETIRESGSLPVTPELLLILSQQSYKPRPDRARVWRTAPFRPGLREKGWIPLSDPARFNRDGYSGIGVYDPDTNTLIVANAGTDPSEADDLGADYNILSGEESLQTKRAEEFFLTAWQAAVARAAALGKPPPSVVVTGHSLGGALAQFQVAMVFADDHLRKTINIRAVTFAGLGAREAIYNRFQRRPPNPKAGSFDDYASGRVLNYVRVGDGFVNGRLGRRPRRVGRDVTLAGLDLERMSIAEAKWRHEPAHPATAAQLLSFYQENHELRSYYHPDFTDPLDVVFSRRRR